METVRAAPVGVVLAQEAVHRKLLAVTNDCVLDVDEGMASALNPITPIAIAAGKLETSVVEVNGVKRRFREFPHHELGRDREGAFGCSVDRRPYRGVRLGQRSGKGLRPGWERLAVVVRETENVGGRLPSPAVSRGTRTGSGLADQANPRRNRQRRHVLAVLHDDHLQRVAEGLAREGGQAAGKGFGPVACRHDDRHCSRLHRQRH